MKSFFIDTNVILDFLIDRKPFSDVAEILFELKLNNKIKLYASAISFNNLYYVIKKIEGHDKAISLLNELLLLTEIIPLHYLIIQKAVKSNFFDFEDAIQYYSALEIKAIKGIVTRNGKDFIDSKIAILTPQEAVSLITS